MNTVKKLTTSILSVLEDSQRILLEKELEENLLCNNSVLILLGATIHVTYSVSSAMSSFSATRLFRRCVRAALWVALFVSLCVYAWLRFEVADQGYVAVSTAKLERAKFE